MKKTDAVVFLGVGEVAVQRLPVPPPAPDEVQIRTSYSAISAGTEGWILMDSIPDPVSFPIVPGYQRVGTIIALGEDVDSLRVGDRVAATVSRWSGSPGPKSGAHIGVGNTPASEVYELPAGVDDIDAAAVVVAQVGYNAASRLLLSPGQTVLVYGDGLIGQLAAQAARARGARVVLAGHRPERLALAAKYSADHTLDAQGKGFQERVRDFANADTVAAVVDTVQSEALQRTYMDLLEHGRGQIVYAGFGPKTVWADMWLLQQHELTTHSISGWRRTRIEATLEMLAKGAMRVRPLVTHEVKPPASPDVYRMVMQKSQPHLGIVFDWRDERV